MYYYHNRLRCAIFLLYIVKCMPEAKVRTKCERSHSQPEHPDIWPAPSGPAGKSRHRAPSHSSRPRIQTMATQILPDKIDEITGAFRPALVGIFRGPGTMHFEYSCSTEVSFVRDTTPLPMFSATTLPSVMSISSILQRTHSVTRIATVHSHVVHERVSRGVRSTVIESEAFCIASALDLFNQL